MTSSSQLNVFKEFIPDGTTWESLIVFADGRCPIRYLLDRIGDTWSVLVIVSLGGGPVRYNELRRSIGGLSKKVLSQRMLTATLRSLERDGLISRRVVASKPPRVEYMLTEMGASLAEPIHALTRWAFAHATLIRDSHEQFDQGGQTQERTAPRAA